MSIRIWFLIQQFVARNDLPEYNHIPFVEYLHCRRCRNRVALIRDYIISSSTVNDLMFEGFFARLLNVEAAQDERYHPLIDDITQAEIYCVECRHLLEWRLISVCQSCRSHTVELFSMRLDELICWNNATFHDFLLGGNNEQAPNDQDGGADEEQYHDQDGDANEQDLGTNEQNADQDKDANEQDVGANEQNVDQDKYANEQDVGANEQNADRDEGINKQVPNQNADIAEGMGNIDLNANN